MTFYLLLLCCVWRFSQVKLNSRIQHVLMLLIDGQEESHMHAATTFYLKLQNKFKQVEQTHTVTRVMVVWMLTDRCTHTVKNQRRKMKVKVISQRTVWLAPWHLYLVSTSHCLQTISDQLSVSACHSFLQHAVSQLVLSISSYLFPISLVTYSNTGVQLQGLHNPARCISSQHHLD